MLSSQGAFRIITGILLAAVMILGITPEPARAQNTATYTVTFQGNWKAESTTDVPDGAHFTTLIGAVHNSQETFWEPGGTATSGVENVAEFGGTSGFRSELTAAGNNVKTIISWPIGGGGGATVEGTVEFSKSHPLFTILSMLGPSPDWFVGLSGHSLLDGNGNWRSTHSVDLFAYDAGTEDGTEWSLSNPNTSPRGTISSLRGKEKFTNVRVARMTFTLMPQVTNPSVSVRGGGAVTEGTNASFTVSANPAPSSNLAINLNVSENSNNGRNFVASGNQGGKTVTIKANEPSAPYTVATVNDNTDEPNGSVIVTVASGNGYTVGSPSSASVTVNDDDATRVTLSAASGNIPENGGMKTITVSLNRALAAGESLTVPLTFVGAAQRNTDYMLAGTPASGVTYNNLNSGSANIVFGSGGRTATLTLSTRDDTFDEGTAETVTVALGTPTPSGLGGGATSSGTARFSITDDDTGTVAGVMISKGMLNLTEGGAVDTYTVVLTKMPTASVTVTATSPDDKLVKVHTGSGQPAESVTLTFTSGNWNQAQTVTVTPQQDDNTKQDAVSITHTVSDTGDYAGIMADSVSVTIADDDGGGGDDGGPPLPHPRSSSRRDSHSRWRRTWWDRRRCAPPEAPSGWYTRREPGSPTPSRPGATACSRSMRPRARCTTSAPARRRAATP